MLHYLGGKFRRIVRYTLLSTLLFGGLFLVLTSLVVGCASTPENITLPTVAPSSAPSSLEEAIAAKDNAVLREHIAIWEHEQSATRKDAFTEALAAYRIGSASDDYRWSLLSVNLFDDILQDKPDFVLARAWRGSANAVYAGNFPINGLLLIIIPGPGLIRLEYVRRAFRDLNDAVEAAPDDPVIRIIRASTFIGMPAIFGGKGTGIEDFATLDAWTNNPASNPQNTDLLASQEWRNQYYLNRARAMAEIENTPEAKKAWGNLLQESNDPIDKELAQWHLK